MANKQRYRYGDRKPVRSIVDAGDRVEVGDLMHQTGGYAAPGSELATTGGLQDVFLGVADGATSGDETEDTEIIINTGGVYEYDCDPLDQDFSVGHLFGAVVTSGAVEDQKVAPTNTKTEAIGVLARRARTGQTTVFIEIKSSVMRDGVQDIA